MPKIVLIIADGLGDRLIKEFDYKTPLEAAIKPHIDFFAANGINGLMHTIGRGIRPGSDVSHMAIFGYDPKEYYPGRGTFEVLGIDMEIEPGDVAFRANFGTVINGVIKDRRAGRIKSVEPFVKELDGTIIDRVRFIMKPGLSHRAGLILRGKGLSREISDPDPHAVGVPPRKAHPLDQSKEAAFTAQIVNKFIEFAHRKIKDLEVNKERIERQKLPANYVLLRGPGFVRNVPKFWEKYSMKAACVAGAPLYKGVAKFVGMDIHNAEGTTGLPTSDIPNKFKKAKELLAEYDFIFIHIKAADNLAEDGNHRAKKKFIEEKIDPGFRELKNLKDTVIVFTADHSTACALKAHTGDPVPIFIYGPGVRTDQVKHFGERTCMAGGLGHMLGMDLMKELMQVTGRAELYGD